MPSDPDAHTRAPSIGTESPSATVGMEEGRKRQPGDPSAGTRFSSAMQLRPTTESMPSADEDIGLKLPPVAKRNTTRSAAF